MWSHQVTRRGIACTMLLWCLAQLEGRVDGRSACGSAWPRTPLLITDIASVPRSSDASKSEMARGGIDRLRMARCRSVASAVIRRAQMRAAFDDLLWNLDVGRSGVVAVDLAPAARVL